VGDHRGQPYALDSSQNATNAGIIGTYWLDGAIQSITWEVDQQGHARTSVSRNDERTNPATIPWKIRRAREKQEAALQKLQLQKHFDLIKPPQP
jgi:hypothetical protein